MTKQELYQEVEKLRKCDKSDVWRSAFKLYKDMTGRSLHLGCSSCCTEVKNWLKK